MVSQGAEVIADGNVHVYGPLRGKAMAGARGDTSARIFTTHLDAELLAVAGVYRVVEDKLDRSLHNQPALVRLDGDTLRIETRVTDIYDKKGGLLEFVVRESKVTNQLGEHVADMRGILVVRHG